MLVHGVKFNVRPARVQMFQNFKAGESELLLTSMVLNCSSTKNNYGSSLLNSS